MKHRQKETLERLCESQGLQAKALAVWTGKTERMALAYIRGHAEMKLTTINRVILTAPQPIADAVADLVTEGTGRINYAAVEIADFNRDGHRDARDSLPMLSETISDAAAVVSDLADGAATSESIEKIRAGLRALHAALCVAELYREHRKPCRKPLAVAGN